MDEALRGATSTKERRAIKEEFRVDTNKASNQTDNQQGVNEDSNQRGDDDFIPKFNNVENDSSGGGGVPAGYEEVLRDYVADDNTAKQEWYLTKAV